MKSKLRSAHNFRLRASKLTHEAESAPTPGQKLQLLKLAQYLEKLADQAERDALNVTTISPPERESIDPPAIGPAKKTSTS